MEGLIPLRRELKRVHSFLITNLQWSPLDFIRNISRSGDRNIYVDFLTREISEEDDLRFLYRCSNGTELAVFAERLPWDSEFFGYNIAKINGISPLSSPSNCSLADHFNVLQKFVEEAKNKKITYLFVPVDPRDLATLQALGRLGFSLIETRLHYHLTIKDYSYEERYPVRIAGKYDVESLGETAQKMVNPYDRFHADPFIRVEDTNRLMNKWVEASILESFADLTIVPDVPNPTAFCTVKLHRNNWPRWQIKLSQIVLSAVSPEFKGWLRKILSEAHYYLCDMGVEHVYYKTQITNIRVTWVLESLGYRFGKGEHIMRIIL